MVKKNMIVLLLAATMTFSLAGCGSKGGQTTPADGSSVPIGETTRTAPKSVSLRGENSFPYLGMSFAVSPGMRAVVDAGLVFVDIDGAFQVIQNADGTAAPNAPLDYGYIHFAVPTEEQWHRMPGTDSPDAITDYDEFAQWLMESTAPVGRLSVFHTSYLEGKELAELTGMESNTEVGQAGDYRFYFSTSAGEGRPADAVSVAAALSGEMAALVENLTVEEPLPMDENYAGLATTEQGELDNVGAFETTDLDGNTVTSSILADYDLNVINVWATWCSPCVEELPYLAELAKEMDGQGVQILGIVADVVDPFTGEVNEDALEKAQFIREKTGVEYPILLPDEILQNNILAGIPGYPKTFFVDKEGNVVGDVLGARSKDKWAQIITETLAQIKE